MAIPVDLVPGYLSGKKSLDSSSRITLASSFRHLRRAQEEQPKAVLEYIRFVLHRW